MVRRRPQTFEENCRGYLELFSKQAKAEISKTLLDEQELVVLNQLKSKVITETLNSILAPDPNEYQRLAWGDFHTYINSELLHGARPYIKFKDGSELGFGWASHMSGDPGGFKKLGFKGYSSFYKLPLKKRNEFFKKAARIQSNARIKENREKSKKYEKKFKKKLKLLTKGKPKNRKDILEQIIIIEAFNQEVQKQYQPIITTWAKADKRIQTEAQKTYSKKFNEIIEKND